MNMTNTETKIQTDEENRIQAIASKMEEELFGKEREFEENGILKNEPFLLPSSLEQIIEKSPGLKKKWEKLENLLADEWTAQISKKTIDVFKSFFCKIYSEPLQQLTFGEEINPHIYLPESEERKKAEEERSKQWGLKHCKTYFLNTRGFSSFSFDSLMEVSKTLSENEEYKKINDEYIVSLFMDFAKIVNEKQKLEDRKIIKQRTNFPILPLSEEIEKAIKAEFENKDTSSLEKEYTQYKEYGSLNEQWEQLKNNFTIRPYYKGLHEANMIFMDKFLQQIFSDISDHKDEDISRRVKEKYDLYFFFYHIDSLNNLENRRNKLAKIAFPIPEFTNEQNELFISIKERLKIIPFFVETKKIFTLAIESKGKIEKVETETPCEKTSCSCCFRKIGLTPVSNTIYDHGYSIYKEKGYDRDFSGKFYKESHGLSFSIREGNCKGVNFPGLEYSLDGLYHFIKECKKEITELELKLENFKIEMGDKPIYELEKEKRKEYFFLDSSLSHLKAWNMIQEKQKNKWEKFHEEKNSVEIEKPKKKEKKMV